MKPKGSSQVTFYFTPYRKVTFHWLRVVWKSARTRSSPSNCPGIQIVLCDEPFQGNQFMMEYAIFQCVFYLIRNWVTKSYQCDDPSSDWSSQVFNGEHNMDKPSKSMGALFSDKPMCSGWQLYPWGLNILYINVWSIEHGGYSSQKESRLNQLDSKNENLSYPKFLAMNYLGI